MAVILDKHEISQLIFENKYSIDPSRKYISRCINGRYEEGVGLPALTLPGGDVGQLAIFYAAANTFGYAIDHAKALRVLLEVIGGVTNFSLCGHYRELEKHPELYNITEEDKKILDSQIATLSADGSKETVLHGAHSEGAMIIVRGSYGIYPRYEIENGRGRTLIEIFTFHQSLVDERHRLLSKKLIEFGAVTLPEGCDEEYLYDALSETVETLLFETAKRLARGLPIYNVDFTEDGAFEVKDMGVVQ